MFCLSGIRRIVWFFLLFALNEPRPSSVCQTYVRKGNKLPSAFLCALSRHLSTTSHRYLPPLYRSIGGVRRVHGRTSITFFSFVRVAPDLRPTHIFRRTRGCPRQGVPGAAGRHLHQQGRARTRNSSTPATTVTDRSRYHRGHQQPRYQLPGYHRNRLSGRTRAVIIILFIYCSSICYSDVAVCISFVFILYYYNVFFCFSIVLRRSTCDRAPHVTNSST